jgi:hypothetical protein
MRIMLVLAGAAAFALVWSAPPVVVSLHSPLVSAHSLGHSPHWVTIYDANPEHLWNRLHATFFVRDDLPETQHLTDVLDPPLWWHTSHLLSNPSHKQALAVLDEFLQTHAENLIRDPVKRAILQRDLWAVFDWAEERQPNDNSDQGYAKERRELRTRLAEVLRRIALRPEELASLPDNYAQAVASGEFGREYDAAHRERAFLPPDLFEARGPWVELEDPGSAQPVAFQHLLNFSGRSSFLVFVRLPGGRRATFDYLQTLWDFPGPWELTPADAEHPRVMNPNVPQFPVGTEVALVRQLTLFDDQGKLVSSPITESVQIRVYREIGKNHVGLPSDIDEAIRWSGQDFYDIELSRAQWFAGKAGGLRALGPDERDFGKFNFHGPDEGRPGHYATLKQYVPMLKQCTFCHQGTGLSSLNSRANLIKPHALQKDRQAEASDPHWWQDARTLVMKRRLGNWAALIELWKGNGGASARGQQP